ncbi:MULTISPECIES: ABC transporter substrate-binding protein [Brevibacterium]|jgi:peptide/nickel transport system substrate-binding protein|uniref:ABC transporter substrate-binding protein n=1 Tax=Brevibacterium salitolerans TaxID=1403566 RepID=A0ABN2WAW4_9MICO|nr:ABC transporter substrate-binding protein [Brevibacterium sp.]
MSRLTTLTATLAAVGLLAAGCSAGSGSTGTAAGEGRTDIVVAHTAEPTNLDFTTTSGAAIPQALMENVYESLVRIDQNGEVQPALADSWELSDDRLTYTFALDPDATFSNGDPVTAEDVKFSYERVVSDEWTNALGAKMDIIDSIETPDEHTVAITLERPSNSWLFELASLVGAVFSPDGVDDLANTAVGSGPYEVESFTRGQELVFAKRDDYAGSNPGDLETVTFRYFADAVAAANALKSGQVDVIGNLQAPELTEEFEADDATQVIEGTTNGEVVLSMNNAEGLFSDQRVREAVLHGIDEQAVLDTAWGGKGTLIGGMVPPTDPYYEDLTDVWPTDVEKARELIDEAGAEGESFTFTVPSLPYAQASAEIVAAQLKEIGLNAQIETQEFPAVWIEQTMTEKSYDMSVVNHAEARDILTVFGEGYYTGYDSSRIEDTALAADEGTEEEYTEGMKDVARTITEDAAAGFLFLFPNLIVADAGVTGLPENMVSDAFAIAQLGWSEG